MDSDRIDVNAVLASLKDFQRRTVQHAFRRLYLTKKNCSRRFLVADEVGLGKTLVARGIIAKTIQHLQDEGLIDRIDIVYVCSNAAIAQQNVNRLNVTGHRDYALATRLTLLPLELRNLGKRKLNFVSFTPGTTFDLKHSTGVWRERLLLFHVLKDTTDLNRASLRNLMQCDVGRERWLEETKAGLDYDKALISKFMRLVGRQTELKQELAALCEEFHYFRPKWPKTLKLRRNQLIGQLRKLLAKSCVDALEPDLVILDEFQRFKDLLGGESDAAELAQELMSYEGVRVLLLSATPYKMLTLYGEDENHYEDFLHTLRFLFDNERLVRLVNEDLDAFRAALYQAPERGIEIQARLQRRLRKVMVRTERVPATRDRDAMVQEPHVRTELVPADLHRASALDRLTRAIGAQEAIEYWKSAPYLLNFMKGYKLKEQFYDHVQQQIDLAEPLKELAPHLLSADAIERYEKIDPGNSRLRALVDRTLANEEWRLLWLPPALAYTESPIFRNAAKLTKSLVFSTWSVVPDVISAVCSFTAERKRVQVGGPVNYFELYDSRKPLLVFKRSEDRLDSMSTLSLMYPSPTLAKLVDPLRLALEQGRPVPVARLREIALERAVKLAESLPGRVRNHDGRVDQSWYWAPLARRDFRRYSDMGDWLTRSDGWRSTMGRDGEVTEGSLFAEHVENFSQGAQGQIELGAVPEDFAEVLAELATGSPAVCANRALRRIAPGLKANSPEILQASAHIAEGFRSLFNSPDVRSMIDVEGIPYWRDVLRYCTDGDLQAVLDEYVHSLKESLGLVDAPDHQVVREVADAIRGVLSIRTSSLEIDDIQLRGGFVSVEKRKLRCRYALRFADLKDDSNAVLQRAGVVREAFNSPFRPFILATTSVGQEGLDFHSYCHRVWHWNLPRNPVDMEQREGRVNRYKGHAVRKNVARAVSLTGLAEYWNGRGDPWTELFKIAGRYLREGGVCDNELMPYWIFEEVENPTRVERLVPLPPFSSENSRFRALKRSLAVYRLAFGQPRQEDLIEYLANANSSCDEQTLRKLQLNLAP